MALSKHHFAISLYLAVSSILAHSYSYILVTRSSDKPMTGTVSSQLAIANFSVQFPGVYCIKEH